MAVTGSLLGAPPAFAEKPPKIWVPPTTPLQEADSVAGRSDGTTGTAATGGVPRQWKQSTAAPAKAGTATVQVTDVSQEQESARRLSGGAAPSSGGKAKVRAGDLPVFLTDLGTAKGGSVDTPSVKVDLLDEGKAKAAGSAGPVVRLEGAGGSAEGGHRFQVALDVKALTGNAMWSDRARLVLLPECALTTPDKSECRTSTPVQSTLDPVSGLLTADVQLPEAPAAGTATHAALDSGSTGAVVQAGFVQQTAAGSSGAMVLAAQAGSSGSSGSFAATPIAPSAAWSAGSNVGNFTYSYTFDMPTAVGGSAPSVMLGYDSSSVDGRTAATNSQSGWIGDGWDYSAGSISRSYKPCDKSGIAMSGDECWAGQSLQLNLAGHSGVVVKDDTTGVLRLQGDDGTLITPLTGLNNGAWNGEGFKVTTTDGTQYYFGANHLPGGDGTDAASNSVNTVPVYHPHTGDPCYKSATGAASWCQMGWQWNLDYVVDLHGNLIKYQYAKESNYYARGGGQNNGTGTRTAYDRYSNVSSIQYGLRLSDQIASKGAGNPASKIDFTTAERCFASGSITCSDAQRVVANQSSWPDTPLDQACASSGTCTNYGPSFWTSKRLTKVETTVYAGGTARVVDSWALNQVFSDPGDGTSPTLWLSSIQRTGKNGQADTTLPAVSFTAAQMPNRVDGLVPAVSQFNRPRMKEVTTETGGRITVTYKPVECSRTKGTMPASEAGNTMACMPVKWVPPGSQAGTKPIDDWFHKYLVSSIVESSLVTSSTVAKETQYAYGGGAAWHRNDSEFADDDTRTYDNFRGYQTVTTTTGSGSDGPRTKSVSTYLRGMGGQVTDSWGESITDAEELAGFVRETQNYESDAAGAKVVGGELTTPWLSKITATHTQPGNLPKVTARYVNTASVKNRSLLSDGKWRTTERRATYDEDHAGRVLTTDVLGDTSLSGYPQRQCTAVSYASGSNPALVESPSRILTLAGGCDQTPSQANTISDALTIYDGQALGTIGDKADQTETRVLESYGTNNTPNYRVTAKAQFDDYGRQVSTTDPNRTDDAHKNGATTTTKYTPATGELPSQVDVTNPLGWKSTTVLDPARGLPTKATDENGRTTLETYDALGRLTAVWLPGRDPSSTDARKTAPNRKFTYALNGSASPSVVTSESIREDRTYAKSLQIYDGLGRVRQSQSMPVQGQVGRLISEAFFDSHGWQVKSTPSYYNAESGPVATVFLPQDSQVPTQTWNEYDGLGRITAGKFISYGQEQWRSTASYPGAERTDATPPPGGYATTTITDATGAAVEVRQYKAGTPTGAYDATTYGYDVAGKPTWVQDSSTPAHRWTYSYDLLGQQTSSTDPDTGTSTVVYDKAGHPVTTTDARGKSISTTYDLLGRQVASYDGTSTTDASKKLTESTYDSLVLGKPTTTTTYADDPNAPGRVAYVSTVTGYDIGYRPTGGSVTIPSVTKETKLANTYTWSTSYSLVLGLVRSTTLPAVGGLAAETVGNSYDVDGNFQTSSGLDYYVQDMQYDAFGRPTRTTVGASGKQVVSTQQYDPGTGNVVQSTLDKQTAAATHVDFTNYTYNKVGSMTSAKTVQDGAATDLQCFTYDYLGRLSAAWTDKGTTTTAPAPSVQGIGGCTNATEPTAPTASARIGGPAPYWQSYSYDLTGNRTKLVQHDTTGAVINDKQTDQTFATGPNTPTTDPATGGGTGGPHALLTSKTSANGTSKVTTSTYDATGNTTSLTSTGGTKTLTWNNQGKLAKVHDTAAPANDTSYVYNADGSQLIRRVGSKTTINLGTDELTLDTVTGKTTATRYYAAPGGLTVTRTADDAGATTLYYQASDPHGTAGVQMDAANLNVARRPTDPFGNARGTQPGNGVWAGDKGFVGGTIEGTGFTNLGARQYDPATGRFLSVDPVFNGSDPQSWNGYAYANNNPVDHADPSGTCIPDDTGRCMSAAGWDAFAAGKTGLDQGNGSSGNGSTTTSAASKEAKNASNEAMRQKQAADAALAKAKQAREELVKKIVDVVGDLIGFNDARDCFTKGDVMGCINTALNFVPWSKVFKAVKVGIKAFKLWREGEKAYDAIRSAERVAQGAEEALTAARKTEKEVAEAEAQAAKQAEADTAKATEADAAQADSGGSCPLKANSFPAGTLVQLADGSTKPIDQLETGDVVLATDPQTGETRPEPITDTITGYDDIEFTQLTLQATDQGEVPAVTSTAHHAYWDQTSRTWVDALDVKVGHQVRSADGTLVTVTAVRTYNTPPTTAHNLTVAGLHTYYVLAGSVPILVHNCARFEVDSSGVVSDVENPVTATEPYNRAKHYGGSQTNGPSGRAARAAAEGQPCPVCGTTMAKGTPHAPVPEHEPALVLHYYRSGGSEMTNAERRAYARDDGINGAACRVCQLSQGAEMTKVSKAIKKNLGL
ncbi:RHS repeat-associated core domain-containing protein [Kitasatospora sp. SolWspMP-SS2h]|uniref:RHS repeat-associated core domain-containing protein n=1 Tax=Kitasatospora sp. SolWspMP-SS2h TaxID=1305729 RepID=UPI001F44887A|nr:RHS repeat-associated core domain-containing protein [Kitasatospora sp. SolWspMP-SS2h]